jgi:hypothetical protein
MKRQFSALYQAMQMQNVVPSFFSDPTVPALPVNVSISSAEDHVDDSRAMDYLCQPMAEFDSRRTISQKVLRRADHPRRVHTPNEPAELTLLFHKALLRTVFGSSQKPAPPDHKNPTAPRTLTLYCARKRFGFTDPIDVGWPHRSRFCFRITSRRPSASASE